MDSCNRDFSEPHFELPKTMSMADIVRQEFKELEYIVDGLLPAGLTLLAGKPKLGKSWLVLAIANAIALGTTALGQYKTNPGTVLYLALEDSPRRLKRRNIQLLGPDVFPDSLHCATEWPRLNEGGIEALQEFVDSHPDIRLLVIDTFAIIRPISKTNANLYQVDYDAMRILHRFATKNSISILAVHHAKKGDAEDVYELMSGSNGLTGAADTLALLKRGRGEAFGELHITGRDVMEQQLALDFDASMGRWTVAGDASELSRTREEREVLEVIRSLKEARVKQIAERLGKPENTIAVQLSRMKERNLVSNPRRGLWEIVSHLPVKGVKM